MRWCVGKEDQAVAIVCVHEDLRKAQLHLCCLSTRAVYREAEQKDDEALIGSELAKMTQEVIKIHAYSMRCASNDRREWSCPNFPCQMCCIPSVVWEFHAMALLGLISRNTTRPANNAPSLSVRLFTLNPHFKVGLRATPLTYLV